MNSRLIVDLRYELIAIAHLPLWYTELKSRQGSPAALSRAIKIDIFASDLRVGRRAKIMTLKPGGKINRGKVAHILTYNQSSMAGSFAFQEQTTRPAFRIYGNPSPMSIGSSVSSDHPLRDCCHHYRAKSPLSRES